MPKFHRSLGAWTKTQFSATLKSEIEALQPGTLPLLKGLSQGNYADDSEITATVLSTADAPDRIQARVGIFYKELIAGCSCGDEPMSVQAYREIQVSIDKITAETDFILLPG